MEEPNKIKTLYNTTDIVYNQGDIDNAIAFAMRQAREDVYITSGMVQDEWLKRYKEKDKSLLTQCSQPHVRLSACPR